MLSWACIQNKEMLEESTQWVDSFQLYSKTQFWRIGADTLTFFESTPFVSISWIFCTLTCAKEWGLPPLFRSNYFHKKSTLLKNPRNPFFMNTALYPWNESTHKKVDSVVTKGIFTWLFWTRVLVSLFFRTEPFCDFLKDGSFCNESFCDGSFCGRGTVVTGSL
jgi:hypothetical protein